MLGKINSQHLLRERLKRPVPLGREKFIRHIAYSKRSPDNKINEKTEVKDKINDAVF